MGGLIQCETYQSGEQTYLTSLKYASLSRTTRLSWALKHLDKKTYCLGAKTMCEKVCFDLDSVVF